MSLTNLPQCNEAVSSENLHQHVNREQGFIAKLTETIQKENLWSFCKKNIPVFDKCFSFLQSTPNSKERNHFQQFDGNFTHTSLVASYQGRNTASSAVISQVNFNPSVQKVNLNNFLMFLLCACIPVGSSPPVKLMLCLPCPAPVQPVEAFNSQNKCEVFPFGIPRKLECCGGQASRKGKKLPAPAKRWCSKNCLHVCDLKPVIPCKADKGLPCAAHCFESHPKCSNH